MSALFYLYTMKAILKIVSAGKFTEDQERIIKRVSMVLTEHNLLVKIERKVKVSKTFKLKAI